MLCVVLKSVQYVGQFEDAPGPIVYVPSSSSAVLDLGQTLLPSFGCGEFHMVLLLYWT